MIYKFPQITFELTTYGYLLYFQIIDMDETLRGHDIEHISEGYKDKNFGIFKSSNDWIIASVACPDIYTSHKTIYLRGIKKSRDDEQTVISSFYYNDVLLAFKEWQKQIKIRRTEDILESWI